MAEKETKEDGAAGEVPAEQGNGNGGTATPDGASIGFAEKAGSSLASVVAAASLSSAAKKIADEVRLAAGNRTVVIVEDRAVAVSDVVLADVENAITGLNTIVAEVERHLAVPRQRRDAVPPQVAGDEAAAAAAAGDSAGDKPDIAPLDLLKQLGDVVGLFRSTFEVAPQITSVDRTALVAAVAGLLAKSKAAVVVDGVERAPAIQGLDVAVPTMASVSDAAVLGKAKDLLVRRQAAAFGVASLEAQNEPVTAELARLRAYLDRLEAQRDKAVIDKDSKTIDGLTPQIEKTTADIARLAGNTAYQTRRAKVDTAKSMLAAVDSGYATLTTPTDTGSSRLVQAALREQVHELGGDDPAVLWLDVTATGGDSVTKRSPLGWNSEASFLGAVQAVYLLVSSNGKVFASGATESFGYQTFDFDGFFDGGHAGRSRRSRQWGYESAEILVVGLVLLVAVALVAFIVR